LNYKISGKNNSKADKGTADSLLGLGSFFGIGRTGINDETNTTKNKKPEENNSGYSKGIFEKRTNKGTDTGIFGTDSSATVIKEIVADINLSQKRWFHWQNYTLKRKKNELVKMEIDLVKTML